MTEDQRTELSASEDRRWIELAGHLLRDAETRMKWQQEIAIAGFRTLILINGGAIIALLTYIGGKSDKLRATDFEPSLIAYMLGLSFTVLAHLFAYYSQGMFSNYSMVQALRMLHYPINAEQHAVENRGERLGNRSLLAAVIASILGLLGFLAGSVLAARALG